MDWGRVLRSWSPSARLLTEIQVRRLRRAASQPEFALATSLARPGSTVIEVGASVGNYALALKKSVGPTGRVIALEPNPEVYRELCHSVWLAGVEPLMAAAAERPGQVPLFVPRDGEGRAMSPLGSLVGDDEFSASVPVQAIQLDDLTHIGSLSLLLIDVEGGEASVIRGARRLICEHRPIVIAEVEQRHLGAGTVADFVDLMAELEYEAAAISRSGLVAWKDFDLERDQTQHVASRAFLKPGSAPDYLNNFVFWSTKQPSWRPRQDQWA